MKTWILGLSLVSLGAGCTINGKPMFGLGGGGSTTPSSGAEPHADYSAPKTTDVVAPKSYAWCKTVKPSDSNTYQYSDMSQIPDVVRGVANNLCHAKPDAFNPERVRNENEASRLEIMESLGMTEADWAREVPDYVNTPRSSTGVDGFEAHVKVGTGPLDQASIINQRGVLGADQVGALSQVGRAELLGGECTRSSEENLRWLCAQEAKKFDLAKFRAELASDTTYSNRDHVLVRMAYARWHLEKGFHGGDAEPKNIEIMQKAQAEWAKNLATRQPFLATIAKLEAAAREGRYELGDKKAPFECANQIAPALTQMIARLGAAAFKGIEPAPFSHHAGNMLSLTPDGWIAGTIARSCAKDDVLSVALHPEAVTFRGPLTAALSAIAVANNSTDYGHASMNDVHAGVIASTSPTSTGIRVTFVKKPKFQNAECAQWRETNKIDSVDPNGHINYRSECVRRENVTIDPTPAPIEVPARFAAGIEKGRYLETDEDIVLPTIYAKEGDELPIAAYGVLLK